MEGGREGGREKGKEKKKGRNEEGWKRFSNEKSV